MHDATFDVAFWLIAGIVMVGLVITALGMLLHFAVIGAVFGLVAKRIGAMHARQAASRTERRCTHCASVLPATVVDCPNCGASAT